jgi:putative ABC transport system permease protein
MRVLLWLALRELWTRRWRSLLSLLALALSAGLIVATGSIGALMRASVAAPAPLLGDPEQILWVTSAYDVDYDLPATLQARVEAVPGVAAVQPVLRRPIRVRTPRPDTLTLLGIEPAPYLSFHDLALAAGEFPSAESPGLVALAPWALIRDLGLGALVTVTTPTGDVPLPVAGLVELESLAAAQHGLVLYAPIDTVAKLFGLRDAVTALELRLAPGASHPQVQADLEHALGPAYAVSAASRPWQRAQLWQRLVMGALVCVDGLTLVGSAGLVYAVFAAAARVRRRQIGLLRIVGAVRRQVLALLVTEASLLGLTGGGIGLVVGLLFAWAGARLILHGAAPLSTLATGSTFPPLPPGSLLLAVALCLLGALAGAIVPSTRAARQPPLAALRTPYPFVPRGPEPGSSSGPRFRTQENPVARRHSRRLATRLLPPESHLALANLARERGRTVLIVGTLALILAMALGNVGVLSLLGHELAATFGRLSGGDYLILPGLTTISLRELAGQDTSDVPPLDPGLLAALEGLGDRVWLMRGTTADVEPLQVFPGQPTLLLDVEGYAHMGGFRFQAGNWPRALASFRRGPAVLLAPVVARRLGVGLGDPVRLDTIHGPVDFTVAGIGDSEFTTCVLDLADGVEYMGVNEVNAVEIQLRPGADAGAVRRALLDAVQTHDGTLLSLGQALGQLRAVFRQARLSISLLIGVTGLVAVLGVINAMLSSVAERRREIGQLRAVGATRHQVRRMILAEAAILGTASAVVGTALGWAVTLLILVVARFTLGLSGEVASTLAAWWPLIAATVAGLALWPLLAMVGALTPALHAARLPVIQALHETTAG